MNPTMVDGSTFIRDAKRAPTIKKGSASRLYVESVVVHPKTLGGTDFNELTPLVLRGVRW